VSAVATRLELVAVVDAHEGPAYAADEDALYVTSLPRRDAATGAPWVAIRRVALDGRRFPVGSRGITTLREPANGANGMCLAPDGSLLVCEQGSFDAPARIASVDRRTGEAHTVVDRVDGRPLSSPNDVVVHADGTIWFTDPHYGHLQGFRPAPAATDALYRHHRPTGTTTRVADSFDKPNGLAFSPGGDVLYVTDSGANQEPGSFHPHRPHHVRALEVDPSGRVTGDRVLAVSPAGFPDGIKVDVDGRVYVSSALGVEIHAPDGEHVGRIELPGAVNFAFGGPDRNVLFITTDTAVWAAVLDARGA
jgi:gluconolactonase